jgi:alpha-galactosidase
MQMYEGPGSTGVRTILFLVFLCATGAAIAQAQAAPAAAEIAPTPQMGFNNWNSTHCRDEFNETMIRGIADKFVELGLKDAGYRYINIDDCWANWQRDSQGNLVPNPERFPGGIKALADYIHSKGLKFGLYSSAGTWTCEPMKQNRGFPGGLGHESQDAAVFASWGVDYLKYDNCNNQKIDARQRYTAMGEALRNTGKPIFYSVCEWGQNKPWKWAGSPPVDANSWRTTGDIQDSYASMLKIFKQNVVLSRYAGPGHWNDPDMLEVGNGGMSETEYRSHFSLWAIMAAPLLIGTDLRKIQQQYLDILLNKEVIAVDQDPLGIQGKRIRVKHGVHVIVKPLQGGDLALALFNQTDATVPVKVTTAELGLKATRKYRVRDLWQHSDAPLADSVAVELPAHATAIYRIGVAP